MENVNVVYANLPTSIPAYIASNSDTSYTIVLNSRLSHERNISSYIHEIKHIIGDDFNKFDVNSIENIAHQHMIDFNIF